MDLTLFNKKMVLNRHERNFIKVKKPLDLTI